MHSHHSHSGQFCRHAKGTLEEVVREAVAQGFKVFGLSEHAPRYRQCDLYPEESDLTPENLRTIFLAYLDEAHRLREAYASYIELLVGLETDFVSALDLDGLDSLLREEGHRIDYVVGSLHHVNEMPIDFDEPTFDRAVASLAPSPSPDSPPSSSSSSSLTPTLHAYFDNQLEMLQRVQPEVVGHFDLIRLYRPTTSFRDHDGVWEKVERNVRYAVGYGALFEVNAAAFRKGWSEAYPASDVLQLVLSLGGRLCLSDDSHGPQAVGLNYHRLLAYLVAQGVEDIWYLSPIGSLSRERTDGGRSGRLVARKAEAGWREDSFWTVEHMA